MILARPMTLNSLATFRLVVLLACSIMLAVALGGSMQMAPAQLQKEAAMNKPAAMLATELAGFLDNTAANGQAAGVGIYRVLLTLAATLFAAAAWTRTDPRMQRPPAMDATLLAIQILIGTLVESNLLYLVAAELAFVLPHRAALPWLGAQLAAFLASGIPNMLHPGLGMAACNVPGILPPPRSIMIGLSWAEEAAFQIFAYCIGYFAAAEIRSRTTLAHAHAELHTAHRLLADAVRAAERERIARRVHHVIGDHLTALNVQLNLARRHMGDQIIAPVQTAHEIARRLLSEVRIVVSRDRESLTGNLRLALETLCVSIPSPRIVLSFDNLPDIDSPALSHTVFRIAQEAVSNTVRHSDASRLDIMLSAKGTELFISISDDGKGMSASTRPAPGNGLRGIRERIEEAGGQLDTGNRPEGGFCLRVRLPLAGGTP